MNPLVELQAIHKSFPGVLALRGVDLVLYPGTIHALIGENGAGKSTLLSILSGLLQPDQGRLLLENQPVQFLNPRDAWRAGIVTVHQEVDLFPDLTVTENLAWQHGMPGFLHWKHARHRAARALQAVASPLSPDTLAGRLTPAQRQLVEIASAVSRSARLLILDEPTSSLSRAESEHLFDHLRRFREQGTAIVYVSHRFEEIFALADVITVLRDGQRVWTGTVADTTPDQLIRHMVGRSLAPLHARPAAPSRQVRLSCTGLTAQDCSFHEVTLQVHAGEIFGLYGLIGAGRSEWAQAVFGLRSIKSGHLQIEGCNLHPRSPEQMVQHGLAYLPEDRLRQGICRGLSVRLNALLASLRQLARLGWLSPALEQRRATALVQRLDVRLASLSQPIATLSGGNQQKVILGRWLERDPSILILDEPTRGVDVGAREEIYSLIRQLADQGKAILLISSELTEIVGHADRIGVFCQGTLVATLPGGTPAEEVAALAFPSTKQDRANDPSPVRLRWSVPTEIGLTLFVGLLFLLLHLVTGRFLQPDSVRSLLTEAALLGFCATGAMLVLLAGGLDISLGALMALSAGVAGHLWEKGYPLSAVFLVAILIGAAGGTLNAALALLGRVHPIVVTLGTMSVYRGLTLWWLGQDVQIPGEQRLWASSTLFGMPLLAWLGLGLVLVTSIWLTYFSAGRELYALGSNPRTALRVGIRPARVWLRAFALQGILIGLAGVLYLARSGSVQPTSHEDRTLEALAAAVVGGVAITGGRGTMLGLTVGCLFLVSLGPACIFLGLSTHWQQSLVGAVLLAAVLVDAFTRRRLQ